MARPGRPNIAALVVFALFTPAVSLLVCAFLAALVPGLDERLLPRLLLNPYTFAIATAFGFGPSLLFGSIGCVAAERWLRRRPFWMWSLAGLGAAGAYVLTSVALHKIPMFDLLAPWAGMLRDPEPPSVIACIIASILAAGVIAATSYRLATQQDQVGFTRS